MNHMATIKLLQMRAFTCTQNVMVQHLNGKLKANRRRESQSERIKREQTHNK